MSSDPFAHGTPVGDSHIWVRPASPGCPNCKCCTAALCTLAKEKDGACHWYGSGTDYDLSACPCWRTDPPPVGVTSTPPAGAAGPGGGP